MLLMSCLCSVQLHLVHFWALVLVVHCCTVLSCIIVQVEHICVVCQVKCPGHYSNMVHGEGRISVMKGEEKRRYMQAKVEQEGGGRKVEGKNGSGG